MSNLSSVKTKINVKECFINGVQYKCRTCFDPGETFNFLDAECSKSRTWRDVFGAVAELKSHEEGLLPNTVCCKCFDKLKSYSDFILHVKNVTNTYLELLTTCHDNVQDGLKTVEFIKQPKLQSKINGEVVALHDFVLSDIIKQSTKEDRKNDNTTFALLQYPNRHYSVKPLHKVQQRNGKFYVKLEGRKYAVKVLLKSDNRTYLVECKNKYKYFPLLNKLTSTSVPKQLVPLIKKLKIPENSSHISAVNQLSTYQSKQKIQEMKKRVLHVPTTRFKRSEFALNPNLIIQSSLAPTLCEGNSVTNLISQTKDDIFNTSFNSDSTSIITSNVSHKKQFLNILDKENCLFSNFKKSTSISSKVYNENNTVSSKSLQSSEHSPEVTTDTTVINADPLIVSRVKVPHRWSQQSKKHFCIFCKTLQTSIARHLLHKHKSEVQIKEARKYASKSKKRSQILGELRKQGDFLHNTSQKYNSGILIVSRQQHAKFQKTPDDYVCCRHCKAFYSQATLRIHLRKCGDTKLNSRDNLIVGRKLTQYLHAAANFSLKTKVFPVLRNDEVTKSIRYDELIIKYGNKLTEKYTLAHQHELIRAKLRLLGRFLIEVKSINNNISELKDIFKPNWYDCCVESLRKVANWDNSLGYCKNPAVAIHLKSLIKKCGSKLWTEYKQNQSDELRQDLENFLLLWEETPFLLKENKEDEQCTQKCSEITLSSSKGTIQKCAYGKKIIRNRWSEEEKDAVTSIFGNLKELKQLPSAQQCLDAIKSNDVLKTRTSEQLKSWIDNQRRYK